MSSCPSSASEQIAISKALGGASQSKLARGLGTDGAAVGVSTSRRQSVILSWQESSAVKRNSNSLRVQVSEFAEKGGASKPHFAGTFCSHCRSLGTKVALSV